MSKSKLTGIAPAQITDVFGSDAFRYYFLRAITFGSDGSFSWEDLAARYEAELANGLGNLASRVLAMLGRYFDHVVPACPEGALGPAEEAIARSMREHSQAAFEAMERFMIHEAIQALWGIVDDLNGYLTEQEPWALAKDEAQRERLAAVLYTAADGLRALAVLLSPVIPQAMGKLWRALGLSDSVGALEDQLLQEAGQPGLLPSGGKVETIEALFPRIDTE